ncbi:FG-GAP repeat domain-containing protein [Tenacibaculum ovolyticum]|uniref:FG-GAP repeat domain-containing protein n=1 Tax=Tenacibaculum ovolyticum TaxID=104270 RepID=UPI003BADA4C1
MYKESTIFKSILSIGFILSLSSCEEKETLLNQQTKNSSQELIKIDTETSIKKTKLLSNAKIWSNDYVESKRWRVNQHPRMLGDINGDGKDDIVAFGDNGIYVSLSNGSAFSSSKKWLNSSYSESNRWRVNQHPRMLGDVNGDGKDDIIAFGDYNVYVSLSNGSAFSPSKKWLNASYSESNHWRVNENPRMVADVNGDGKDDIIAFGDYDIYVSLSNGNKFSSSQKWLQSDLVEKKGWKVNKHPRIVADVNGDNKADIVAFGSNNVYISLSNGNKFQPTKIWTNDFVQNKRWRVNQHPRMIGDVDGDGKDDIVAFGDHTVYSSFSNGTKFQPKKTWTNDFVQNKRWRVNQHPRMVGDVDGDGKDDIVAFGDNAIYVIKSNF